MELDERRARHKALQEKVHQSTARRYCEVFLRHLMVSETHQSLAPAARMIAR
jgi:trehalose-6-phosphate synthase